MITIQIIEVCEECDEEICDCNAPKREKEIELFNDSCSLEQEFKNID